MKLNNALLLDASYGTRAIIKKGEEYFYAQNLESKGSETIMPLLDELLKKSGLTLSQMDALGACIGPGSFTGIRIGLATIKSMCYALNKKAFAVTSLKLMAYKNTMHERTISIGGAGNGVYYAAVYSGGTEILAPKCYTESDVKALIKDYGGKIVRDDKTLCFGGEEYGGEEEMKAAIDDITLIGEDELIPLYIRKPQPERKDGDL